MKILIFFCYCQHTFRQIGFDSEAIASLAIDQAESGDDSDSECQADTRRNAQVVQHCQHEHQVLAAHGLVDCGAHAYRGHVRNERDVRRRAVQLRSHIQRVR